MNRLYLQYLINAEGYLVLTVFTLAFLDLIFIFNIFMTGFAVVPSSVNVMNYTYM